MKKQITLLITSFMLVCACIAYAGEAIPQAVEEKKTEVSLTLSSENSGQMIEKNELFENAEMKEDVKALLVYFTDAPFTAEEQTFIVGLLKKGYSAAQIKVCADFWLDTDEPLSSIETMLSNLPENREADEGAAEEAYNKMTKEKGGNLTYQDVKKLVEEGMQIGDLYTANTLSRKGIYDIHTIIEKFKEKGNFVSVMREIYEKTTRDKIDLSGVSDETLKNESPENIFKAVRLSRMTSIPIKTILEAAKEPDELLKEAQIARRDKIKLEIPAREAETIDAGGSAVK